jgi:hypothetical protein
MPQLVVLMHLDSFGTTVGNGLNLTPHMMRMKGPAAMRPSSFANLTVAGVGTHQLALSFCGFMSGALMVAVFISLLTTFVLGGRILLFRT